MAGILSTLKPFTPFLLTFLLPRLINGYRTAKVAYKTRPPPRPLPPDATWAVNILFFGACLFFFNTLPLPAWARQGVGFLTNVTQYENVFQITNSRMKIPTDVLFNRLATLRHNEILTAQDEILRDMIGSIKARNIYLRYGPEALMSCSFCRPEDPQTYLLYYLPTNVLLPHLLQLLFVGLSTSAPLTGDIASIWRTRFTVTCIVLAALDLYSAFFYEPMVDVNQPGPSGLFWTAGILRPLALCFFNAVAAFLIYASATNRFVLFISPITPAAAPENLLRRQGQMMSQTTVALQMARTRLNTYSITRNAVVRDGRLKEVDDEYWRTMVAMEGPSNSSNNIWEDEDVQAAVARVMGAADDGQNHIEKISSDATSFVERMTKDLERNPGATR